MDDIEVPWSYLPITVGIFAAISGLLVQSDVSQFQLLDVPSHLDPVELMSSMIFHSDFGHYRGNMLYTFLPFGITLTLLTSNRHVLGVILFSHGLSGILLVALGALGVGSSIAAFGILAATLVRAVALGMQNESDETFQTILVGLLTPFLLVLFVLILFNVPPDINHTGHFFGFLFGAGYESIYVFEERAQQ